MAKEPYEWAAIGGTFDRLHKGHKTLLRRAFELSKKVLIGLTTQEMVQHKPDWEIITNYEKRKSELEKWLDAESYKGRYTIRPLPDKFGPAITQPELQLIVVSEETCPVAKEINEIRRPYFHFFNANPRGNYRPRWTSYLSRNYKSLEKGIKRRRFRFSFAMKG